VVINANNIVLDCDGHTITGTGPGFGISASGRTNVTIKNCRVTKFGRGIALTNTNNSLLLNNTVFNNTPLGISLNLSSRNNITGNTAFNNSGDGIQMLNSSNNTLTDNNASKNAAGIVVTSASSGNNFTNNIANENSVLGINVQMLSFNNMLVGNTANNNAQFGFSYSMTSPLPSGNKWIDNTAQENLLRDLNIIVGVDAACNILIENMTGSGNRPILYANSSVNWSDLEVSEMILCNADASTLDNITVRGSDTLQNNQLALLRTDDSMVSNSNSSNNRDGILLGTSNRNNLSNNTANSNNQTGISLGTSNNNTLTDNTADNNLLDGFVLSNVTGNNLINNTAQDNVRFDLAVANPDSESVYSGSKKRSRTDAFILFLLTRQRSPRLQPWVIHTGRIPRAAQPRTGQMSASSCAHL
jgi:parallel beta-helix repeat protein